MSEVLFIDAHSHAYELKDLDKYLRDTIILSVGDDYESSVKNIDLSEKYENFIPAIGIHPWDVGDASKDEITNLLKLVEKSIDEVRFLGEIGLDKKFVPRTFDKQIEVFRKFLELAREYGLGVNLHAAGAWREAYNLVCKYDIEVVIFHWYTGPIDLIREITSSEYSYYFSINAAAKIQNKHRNIIKHIPSELLLTESDSPYKYRGLELTPKLINEVVKIIAKEKSVKNSEVKVLIWRNFRELLKKVK